MMPVTARRYRIYGCCERRQSRTANAAKPLLKLMKKLSEFDTAEIGLIEPLRAMRLV